MIYINKWDSSEYLNESYLFMYGRHIGEIEQQGSLPTHLNVEWVDHTGEIWQDFKMWSRKEETHWLEKYQNALKILW